MHELTFKNFPDNLYQQRRLAKTGSSTNSIVDDGRSTISNTRSYASTSATSVSISGEISSQLHGGYSHPLARSWQAERQLTKVKISEPRKFDN